MSSTLLPDAAWDDLFQAADFAARRFQEWVERGVLRADQVRAILDGYDDRRRRWSGRRENGEPPPRRTGLPPGTAIELPALRSLRYWTFLGNDVRKLRDDGHLRHNQAEELLDEVHERRSALERRLPTSEIPEVLPADELDEVLPPEPRRRIPPPPLPTPRPPRKPLLEILLDPRNIQWLLAFGGGLMFVGVVILLWINEVFTPTVLAGVLAVSNLAVLLGGWSLLRLTRYQLAGMALTLLACLVMPLNLWYLQAHDLLTLEGHLWVAGLICCALYAVSAWVLRDEAFVYVLVGGVAAAGLLAIASLKPVPMHFWEVVAPSTMLVALGLLCIHAERAFPEAEGPFGRKRFGLAFFFSGHAALAAGLLLMLGAFVTGKWAYPLFEALYRERGVGPSSIVGTYHWLALVLVLAAAYAYAYSDLVVRHVGGYVHIAALTLLWALVLAFEEFKIELSVDVAIALLAGLTLVINLLQGLAAKDSPYTRTMPILAVLLPLLAVWLGLVRFANDFTAPIGWGYIGAMALTIVACRLGAHLHKESSPWLAAVYFFATGAATLVGAVALLNVLGLRDWPRVAPVVMLIPIAYAVAAAVYQGGPSARPLLAVAHCATVAMIAFSLGFVMTGLVDRVRDPINLWAALFALECAVFYALAGMLHRQTAGIHLAAVMACGVVWQLFNYYGVDREFYVLTFAIVGLGMLAAYRFALLEGALGGPLTDAAYAAANTLLSLSFIASGALTVGRLASGVALGQTLVVMSLSLTAVSLLAVFLTRQRTWQRWYVVTTIGQGLLAFLVVMNASDLTAGQKVQVFCVVAGLVLLIASHVGWYREQERDDDLVSTGLFLGSLLFGWPMAIAALYDRAGNHLIVLNEVGFLVTALLLLTTGVLFQIRATAVNGAILTAVYFVTLLLFIPWGRLGTVALVITIGGGVLFGLGLVLSVFREHLLTLPQRIKERQGVFRVLTWR